MRNSLRQDQRFSTIWGASSREGALGETLAVIDLRYEGTGHEMGRVDLALQAGALDVLGEQEAGRFRETGGGGPLDRLEPAGSYLAGADQVRALHSPENSLTVAPLDGGVGHHQVVVDEGNGLFHLLQQIAREVHAGGCVLQKLPTHA